MTSSRHTTDAAPVPIGTASTPAQMASRPRRRSATSTSSWEPSTTTHSSATHPIAAVTPPAPPPRSTSRPVGAAARRSADATNAALLRNHQCVASAAASASTFRSVKIPLSARVPSSGPATLWAIARVVSVRTAPERREMRRRATTMRVPSRVTLTLVPSRCSHSTATSRTPMPEARAIAMISTSHAKPSSRDRGRRVSQTSRRAALAPHWVSTMPGVSASCTARLYVRPRNSRTGDCARVIVEAVASRLPIASTGARSAARRTSSNDASGVDRSRSQNPATGVWASASPARTAAPFP